jgi:hypothetical protein
MAGRMAVCAILTAERSSVGIVTASPSVDVDLQGVELIRQRVSRQHEHDREDEHSTWRLRSPEVDLCHDSIGSAVGKPLLVDWRRRYPDFPEPVITLRAGLVWAWPDVEKWAKATGRAVSS